MADIDAIRADAIRHGYCLPLGGPLLAHLGVDDLAALLAEVEALRAGSDAVGDLLAVLLGDGGHRQAEVGTEQAAREALERVHALRQRVAEAPSAAEVETLRAQLADRDDDAHRALASSCPLNERHCSCVPHLRAAVDGLRRQVEVVRSEGLSTRDASYRQGRDDERDATVAYLRKYWSLDCGADIEEGKHHVADDE